MFTAMPPFTLKDVEDHYERTVDYDDIKKTILRLVEKILSKLGINKEVTSESIESLDSFKSLEKYILENYSSK